MEKRDHGLKAKLDAERDGILGWLVEGAIRYTKVGKLVDSARIAAETAAYKLEMDLLGQFFQSGVAHLDAKGKVSTKELHDAYAAWTHDTEQTALKPRTVRLKLQEQYGIEAYKSGKEYYPGITLGPSKAQVEAELKAVKAPDNAEELDGTPAEEDNVVDLEVRRRTNVVKKGLDERARAKEEMSRFGGW